MIIKNGGQKMLLKISTYLTHYFIKKNIIKSNLSQIYIYGFQLTISTLCSFLSILLLSSFFNFIFGITFLFLLIYALFLHCFQQKYFINIIYLQ